MSQEVAVLDSKHLDTKQEVVITSDQAELVKRTVAPDATDSELQLYFYDCTRRGVHPLDRLLHFTKRQGKYTPITSIDLFRMRADQTGLHLGTDEPQYQGVKATPDFAAKVTLYKLVAGQKVSFSATARWSEYFPGDAQGFMWKKMPHLMLGKCAEALALRKAFPAQLHGLYIPEEMEQAEAPATVHTTVPVESPVSSDLASSAFVWRLGKWKGTPIDSVDEGYLDWFAKNGKVEDHKQAAQQELDRRMGQAVILEEEGYEEEPQGE